MEVLERTSGGADGSQGSGTAALVGVVFRIRLGLGGIEFGGLVEVVGEGFLGGLSCLPTAGHHGPFCARFHQTALKKTMEAFGPRVAATIIPFPLNIHRFAEVSAVAAECAAEQAKFAEYADALFLKQAPLGVRKDPTQPGRVSSVQAALALTPEGSSVTYRGSAVGRPMDRKVRSNGNWAPRDLIPPLRAAFVGGLFLLPAPARLSGQTVQGHLNDARSGFAVNGATVSLRDSTGRVVGRSDANYMGAFRITAPGPGEYSLLAEAMGYGATFSDSFELKDGEIATVDLDLPIEPLELDTLAVETRRQRIVKKLEGQGFYDRQRQGIGSFLTSEQIKRWPAVSVGDVLQHVPFVDVTSLGVQGSVIKVRGCGPTIYVDGMKVRQELPGNNVDQWVRPEDIVAVEVYRGSAQIPLQWGMNETCGVILIWTSFGGGGRS